MRSFGQVFAFKKAKSDEKEDSGVSVGVRGPVSIHPAFSISPIDIASIQITKSVNSEPTKDGSKSSDTMGMKHRVDFGVYVFQGAINCQLSEKTGFTEEDADKIHKALITLFENDASSARPEGSMVIERVYWWKHNCKSGQYPSVKVHKQVKINIKDGIEIPTSLDDYDIKLEKLDDLEVEIFEI